MTSFTRRVAAAFVSAGVASVSFAQAPGTAPPATPPVASPAPETRPEGVAATVNGHAIPEVAVYRALRQIPEADRPAARTEIISNLIENAVIDQYLTALKITAEAAEIDKLIEEIKAELKTAGKDYTAELNSMLLTEGEFRAVVAEQMKWDKFVKQQGTDEALRKLYDASPNVFDGSMVRAKHILMTPGSDAAGVEKARQTLASIKATVEAEAKKAADAAQGDAAAKANAANERIEQLFGEYAKQYSSCPSKKEGGELGYFQRVGAMVEPFAAAAFGLNAYQMSDVVQTEFGYHLILVTARKAGTTRKFEDVKEDVRVLYAIRLREAVLNQMKPKAQVVVNPAK